MIRKFLEDHQSIASVLTIIVSIVVINNWQFNRLENRFESFCSRSESRTDKLYEMFVDLLKDMKNQK